MPPPEEPVDPTRQVAYYPYFGDNPLANSGDTFAAWGPDPSHAAAGQWFRYGELNGSAMDGPEPYGSGFSSHEGHNPQMIYDAGQDQRGLAMDTSGGGYAGSQSNGGLGTAVYDLMGVHEGSYGEEVSGLCSCSQWLTS